MKQLAFVVGLSCATTWAVAQISLDDIIAVDSLQLQADIQFIALYDELIAREDSLSTVVDAMVMRLDSLAQRADTVAYRNNYMVTKIRLSSDRLIDRHFSLQRNERMLTRHYRWLDRYYRRATFVRYRRYYIRPRDKWANRVFWAGNAAIVTRIAFGWLRRQ